MDSSTSTLIGILRERVDRLVAEHNHDEAVHAANAAVERAQHELSSDLDSIDHFVDALEIRADLLRSLGRYEAASDDYLEAIDQLEQRPDRQLQVARMQAGLGAVHDALGDTGQAAEHWKKSVELFETADPPAILDAAAMANNVAYLRKADGDVDSAETYFLKALEIFHDTLGPRHEETAAVSNNLGALYQSAGYHEQAREMHMMALEARREQFGDEHPDTAQSHNNLALAMAETGDRPWARRHFEKAMKGFEALGNAYREDFEAVVSNYCHFLREEGETALADMLEGELSAQLTA